MLCDGSKHFVVLRLNFQHSGGHVSTGFSGIMQRVVVLVQFFSFFDVGAEFDMDVCLDGILRSAPASLVLRLSSKTIHNSFTGTKRHLVSDSDSAPE